MRLCKTVVIKCTMVARTAFSVVFVSLQATAQQWCSGFFSTQPKADVQVYDSKEETTILFLTKFFFFFLSLSLLHTCSTTQHHSPSATFSKLKEVHAFTHMV